MRSLAFVALLLVAWFGAGCDPSAPPVQIQTEIAPLEATATPMTLVAPYPQGLWRSLEPTSLNQVVLWTSHILIRYTGAHNEDTSLVLAYLHSVAPPPVRTRQAAFELARSISEVARRQPTRFADLAREHSEDIVTKGRGGSLGGIRAGMLITWPQVLDALAVLRPGEASEVVESMFGFHILYRSAPPPEERVAGSQIVIGHDDAPWLHVLKRGELPRRTRAAALLLAQSIYEEAARSPEDFERLVERHSEHRDAAIGGDFGEWSSREPTHFPQEIEVLRGTGVGQVAPPMDSLVGFKIIKRTPLRPRQEYAMVAVNVYFDSDFGPSSPPADPTSKEKALSKAQALSQLLNQDPSAFSSLQAELCCKAVEQWVEGRGSPLLTIALSQLQFGQIATAPIQSEFHYAIVKRIEPGPITSLPVSFEVPDRAQP